MVFFSEGESDPLELTVEMQGGILQYLLNSS